MYVKVLSVIFLLVTTVAIDAWSDDRRNMQEQRRGGVHYHSKRHMLPAQHGPELRRRVTTLRPRDGRKQLSGHLTALQEDDIDNEVVSVAIRPPPVRPKYEKLRKNPTIQVQNDTSHAASALVKEVLTQLGREFLSHQVNEDFVFGQYVGNAMRNLTSELRLRMQHDILDLVVKYQKLNQEGPPKLEERPSTTGRENKIEKKHGVNETDDSWPDFTNLAKIVG